MEQKEYNSGEYAVFRKKIKKMKEYKGRGTELISLYVPENADRSQVMSQLTDEISQSSNIKSPTTRKNVQGALRKITNFLKQIDFKIPKKGIVVLCGNISETEGKQDIKLFTIKPPKDLKTKLYWCDSSFHLDPLQEMMSPDEIYAIATIDKNEATIARLDGKKYEILGHFTSGVAGKTRAGGQSNKRFEHLREEAAQKFYKRISEKINAMFVPEVDKLKGMIISGAGITKNYFINKDLIDYRIKAKIIGTIDTGYTDESGIRETIQKSDEILKETDLMKEIKIIEKFMGEIAKNGLAMYGRKNIEKSVELGQVEIVIISQDIDLQVDKTECQNCGNVEVKVFDMDEQPKHYCSKCQSQNLETLENIDYIDYMIEQAEKSSARVEVISTDTSEGKQFLQAFGGVGAILRYKI